ncbi:MAG: RelA/SpoT domain-containing protein [Pseudomonadota bacterium]
MKRVYSDQLADVQKYLGYSNRRSNFAEFQKIVKTEILRNLETPSHFSLVSEIFSREEKNPSVPIKSDQKIALKLYKWSKGKSKKERPKPSDIHDIAGVTVVCNYPSDTDEVAELLKDKFRSNLLGISKVTFRDPNTTKGYRAYHAIATGKGKFNGITCEIQIKTSLTMSWGAKTHDLTYKPLGEIDHRLNLYMEKLTNVALILDEQSEILKSLIFEAWQMDEERRDAARLELILGVKTSGAQQVDELVELISTQSTELSVSSLADNIHDEILQKIEDCKNDMGCSKDLCRVAVLYALSRKFGDRNDWAIEQIDHWHDFVEGDEDLENEVLSFRSIASMVLGEYEEAIETGREVLSRAEKKGDGSLAKANLAYFLSEAFFHRAFDESSGAGELVTEVTDDCAAESLSFLDEIDVDQIKDEAKRFRVEDTIGAVLITCSQEEEHIRRGLEICKAALSRAVGTEWEEASKVFFSLHEKRAFRRLIAFK